MPLRVEIVTDDCEEDVAYIHVITDDTPNFEIMNAIEVLYGSQGVQSILIKVVDDPE